MKGILESFSLCRYIEASHFEFLMRTKENDKPLISSNFNSPLLTTFSLSLSCLSTKVPLRGGQAWKNSHLLRHLPRFFLPFDDNDDANDGEKKSGSYNIGSYNIESSAVTG